MRVQFSQANRSNIIHVKREQNGMKRNGKKVLNTIENNRKLDVKTNIIYTKHIIGSEAEIT